MRFLTLFALSGCMAGGLSVSTQHPGSKAMVSYKGAGIALPEQVASVVRAEAEAYERKQLADAVADLYRNWYSYYGIYGYGRSAYVADPKTGLPMVLDQRIENMGREIGRASYRSRAALEILKEHVSPSPPQPPSQENSEKVSEKKEVLRKFQEDLKGAGK